MADQFGDKIHDATPFRREQAREEGHVVRSQDLVSAAVLVGGLLILLYLGGSVADFLAELTKRQLGGQAWLSADRTFIVNQWNLLTLQLGRVILPVLGLLMLLAVAANMGQVGWLWLPQKLALDLSRVSPMQGLKRLFSLSNVVRLAFGLFKIGVVCTVAAWSLWNKRDAIFALSSLELPQIALFLVETALWTCLKIGAALLILALLDYGYQWWNHEQELKMTHQELREEMKSLQGDPQIAARRKSVQRQLALNRLSTTVPQADVVVTNPTELAIAIRYDYETMEAPIVVAKGAGVLAQRIRRLALESNIPIVERKDLARFLYKHVEINKPVPAEQYAAVAEVLRYVYQLKGKTLPGMGQAA